MDVTGSMEIKNKLKQPLQTKEEDLCFGKYDHIYIQFLPYLMFIILFIFH